MNWLQEARRYAHAGFRVLPLSGKVPFERGGRGVLDATCDDDQLRKWAAKRPPNLGLACGGGLAVLDVDPRNAGIASLWELEQAHGRLPTTPRSETGGGGWHYLFRVAGACPGRVLRPGVDLKGERGYIVAPPSRHPETGRVYRWTEHRAPWEMPLAELPEWVLATRPPKPSSSLSVPGGLQTGGARSGILFELFAACGWLSNKSSRPGVTLVRCPWELQHTTGQRFDSSTVLFAPTPGRDVGAFRCDHSHCKSRGSRQVLALFKSSEIEAAKLGDLTLLRELLAARKMRAA